MVIILKFFNFYSFDNKNNISLGFALNSNQIS